LACVTVQVEVVNRVARECPAPAARTELLDRLLAPYPSPPADPAAAAATALPPPPPPATVAVLAALLPQMRRPLSEAHAGGLAGLVVAGAGDAATAACPKFAALTLAVVSRHPDRLGPHRAALNRAAEALAAPALRKPILSLIARLPPPAGGSGPV
jgi:hypothetical protein